MRVTCRGAIRRSATLLGAAAAVCVVGLALVACRSAPQRPMPYDVIARLRPGTTTMAQARAALGAPGETEERPDGGQVWIYRFAPEPVPTPRDLPTPRDAHRTVEVLRLVFGPTGVLMSHEATRSMLGVASDDAERQAGHEALRDIPFPE